MRRWLRRIGVFLLAFVLAVTAASAAYNLATRNRDRLVYDGPSVVVDGTHLAFAHWGRHGSPVVLLGGFVEPTSV